MLLAFEASAGRAFVEAGVILRCQIGDTAACEAALEPARAAIAGGLHKAPSGNPAHTALPYLRSFTAPWVYTMMMTLGVSLLEKQRKYAEATDLLRQLLGAHLPCLLLTPRLSRVLEGGIKDLGARMLQRPSAELPPAANNSVLHVP